MVDCNVATTSAGCGFEDVEGSNSLSKACCGVMGGTGAPRASGRWRAKSEESLRSERVSNGLDAWIRREVPASDIAFVLGTEGKLSNQLFDFDASLVTGVPHASSFDFRPRPARPLLLRPLPVRGGADFAAEDSVVEALAGAVVVRGLSDWSPGGHDAFELDGRRW